MSEFDHVRDEACRQAFLDTRQIREELNELRKQKKEKIDQMQENRSVQKPEMERELHQLELKREKLFKEKDVLHRSISLSPEEQIARLEEDRKQDEFMAMVRSRRPIRDECNLLKQRIVDFTKKAELLNERVTRAHENAPKRPIAELLAEVKASHAKLQKAHGSKVEANIAKASREHKLLQSQLDAANLYSTLQNEFLETAKAIEASHASLTKKGKELETIEKKMEAHDKATGRSADDKKDQKVKDAEREARKNERKAKVDKVHLQIDAKKLEIDALKDVCCSLFFSLPPDFYPAYRRVKACTDGVQTYTALYAPLRGGKNQVALCFRTKNSIFRLRLSNIEALLLRVVLYELMLKLLVVFCSLRTMGSAFYFLQTQERKKINDKYDYGSGKELDALVCEQETNTTHL